MRLSIALLTLSLFVAGASADPAAGTSYQAQSPHGGYTVMQGTKHSSIAFFGSGGFASNALAHAHDQPNFVLRPAGFEDDGHGNKIAIYKKVYYATPEEAEAAKGQ